MPRHAEMKHVIISRLVGANLLGFLLLSFAVARAASAAEIGDPKEPAASVSLGTEMTIAPFGTWTSPIDTAEAASSWVGVSNLRVRGTRLFWIENQPEDEGPQAIMTLAEDATTKAVTPSDAYVRTLVHGYGGDAFIALDDGSIVYSSFPDGRLFHLKPNLTPVALTESGFRFADFTKHPHLPVLICVREDHTEATVEANGEERNEIVAVWMDGSKPDTVLVSGPDFVAYPRLNSDASRMAWIQWNKPQMPWDSTELIAAELGPNLEVISTKTIVSHPDQAVLEPQWAEDGSLYFINDPSGWWNLYHWFPESGIRAVAPMMKEMGGPLWLLGESTYLLTPEHAVVRVSWRAVDSLVIIDLASGQTTPLDLPYSSYYDLRMRDTETFVAIASSFDNGTHLIEVDLSSRNHRVLYAAPSFPMDSDSVSRPEAITFPTAGPNGESWSAHAWFYPPQNRLFQGPEGTKPPLLVTVHGGPTAVAHANRSVSRQFWTTRGFAVVDVNYGGSTTFGREFRRRLFGNWGVVDLIDTVAAVDYLVARGAVDPSQVAIRGGSAGGFTALCALAFTDRFRAAANYFGVSDIEALFRDSHKFERHYGESLLAPATKEVFRARSPIHHLEGFNEPLITFQGSDDDIVPPSQSRMIVEAVRRKGVPVAYLEFEGEKHGFRIPANFIRSLEAELYFYGRVFGFEPAGDIPPIVIDNLSEPLSEAHSDR
jgi:dipeptidyl aminopeptidase/acylaminoacyl peptidase